MMKKNIFMYLLCLICTATGVGMILMKGMDLGRPGLGSDTAALPGDQPIAHLQQSFFSNVGDASGLPLNKLLLQLVVILVLTRIVGALAQKVKQPAVTGEIVAGILLGPTFLGALFPGFSRFLFPVESLKILGLFSQFGLILFMFLIGMELDLSLIRKKAMDALLISHTGILLPFLMGVALAFFIYTDYAPAPVLFVPFAMFVGISLSITAFPVLARILHERGMFKTAIGNMALTTAATGDVTVWCVLPIVIAIAKAESVPVAVTTIVLSLLFIVGLLAWAKPGLNRVFQRVSAGEGNDQYLVAGALFLLLSVSLLADLLGIHYLMGAFLAGILMPEAGNLKHALTEKLEDVSVLLLLPVFFTITGLRTHIDFLNNPQTMVLCALVIGIAIAGKFGGTLMAARFTGYGWKDALTLGTLMNTRGLMELIILNIGYDAGIITKDLFSVMVLMAIVTTLMAGPILEWIERKKPRTNDPHG